jgi:hypothetical protein
LSCTAYKNNSDNSPYKYYTFPYQYKCSCGGEFVAPFYKWISDEIRELGNTKIVAHKDEGHYGKVCPFCDREMKGLS